MRGGSLLRGGPAPLAFGPESALSPPAVVVGCWGRRLFSRCFPVSRSHRYLPVEAVFAAFFCLCRAKKSPLAPGFSGRDRPVRRPPGARRARAGRATCEPGASRPFCIKSMVKCIRCAHVLSIFEMVWAAGHALRRLLPKIARSVAAGAPWPAVHKPNGRPQGEDLDKTLWPFVRGRPQMPAGEYANGFDRGFYRCRPIHFSKKWADGAAGTRPRARRALRADRVSTNSHTVASLFVLTPHCPRRAHRAIIYPPSEPCSPPASPTGGAAGPCGPGRAEGPLPGLPVQAFLLPSGDGKGCRPTGPVARPSS